MKLMFNFWTRIENQSHINLEIMEMVLWTSSLLLLSLVLQVIYYFLILYSISCIIDRLELSLGVGKETPEKIPINVQETPTATYNGIALHNKLILNLKDLVHLKLFRIENQRSH
jgi:hypothetical protein